MYKFWTVILVASMTGIVFGGLWPKRRLEDRTTAPRLPSSALETVAVLEMPPGNVAVSKDHRIFFTFHPAAHPQTKVAQWVGGKALPFPSQREQRSLFSTPLAIHFDGVGRLWVLDYANFRLGPSTPRILAFDTHTRKLIYDHRFPLGAAGVGSMLNDFAVDTQNEKIFISDTSPLAGRPAILIHDMKTKQDQRLWEASPFTRNGPFEVFVDNRPVRFGGVIPLSLGVDGIALGPSGEFFYFAPLNAGKLYRVRLKGGLPLGAVEKVADTPMTDGIWIDDHERVYLSDMEHSAIARVEADGRVTTLFRAESRLRWPDGFSEGPSGWVYVFCSALHDVFRLGHRLLPQAVREAVKSKGPFFLLRFRP